MRWQIKLHFFLVGDKNPQGGKHGYTNEADLYLVKISSFGPLQAVWTLNPFESAIAYSESYNLSNIWRLSGIRYLRIDHILGYWNGPILLISYEIAIWILYIVSIIFNKDAFPSQLHGDLTGHGWRNASHICLSNYCPPMNSMLVLPHLAFSEDINVATSFWLTTKSVVK